MTRALILLLCFASLAAPAAAQPRPELMFIHGIKDTTVRLEVGTFIDAWTLDDNIATGPLDPGSHVVHVTLANSRKLSRAFLFSTVGLAERNGRRYWCVVLGAETMAASEDDLVLLEPADCERQLKALDGHR